jgi:hypothetical protein
MMRALMLPIFAAAVLHLRAECLSRAGGRVPHGVPRLAALARAATGRIWISVVGVAAASACAALLVTGWFHRWTDVSLVRLGSYHAARPSRAEILYDRVPLQLAETKRFRFPPAFATLRSGVEVGGAEGGACLATFAVRAAAAEPWASPPVPAGSGVRPVEVPFALGTTDLTLSVNAGDCPPGTTYEWVAPRLVPWRPADTWGPDDALYVSDREVGTRWPLSLLAGEGIWRRDRSARGGPISIGGRRFAKGLGVQADSVLTVRVPDGATTFASDVGYADDGGPQDASGTLRFVVAIDGREAHRSVEIPPGQLGDVRVPVEGARRVTLVVESTAPSPDGLAAWGDARFLRGERQ